MDEKMKRLVEMKEGASLFKLKSKLETLVSMEPPSASCCIYNVPPSLRQVNEEAYTPIFVSIGPLYHGNPRLESMEQLKLWYLQKFLKKAQGKSLDNYAKYLQDEESRIRRCYSETILMESDEFVSMILTDACFIIELFLAIKDDDLASSDGQPSSDHDPLLASRDGQPSSDDGPLLASRDGQPSSADPLISKRLWPKSDIMQDLILIENQLPFFVLEDLFHQTFPTGYHDVLSFLDLTVPIFVFEFSGNIYYTPNLNDKMFDKSSFPDQIEHFCDILRAFCLPSNPPSRINSGALKRSYSLSQLHEAGVKLQAHEGRKLTEISFSEGVLRIPSIRVSNLTELLLRNVVVFEQCHYPSKLYVSDYVVLLDFLIQSGKDAEILFETGIMESFLDRDAVASMFSNLRMNIIETDTNSDYISLHEELDTFYNDHYHKYKAIFVRDYWSTPWKKASASAAVLLLLLTLIQTICSIIPLFKK